MKSRIKSMTPRGKIAQTVVTFGILQQRTAVKATTACAQVVIDNAFLAERLVVLASLGRKAGASSEV